MPDPSCSTTGDRLPAMREGLATSGSILLWTAAGGSSSCSWRGGAHRPCCLWPSAAPRPAAGGVLPGPSVPRALPRADRRGGCAGRRWQSPLCRACAGRRRGRCSWAVSGGPGRRSITGADGHRGAMGITVRAGAGAGDGRSSLASRRSLADPREHGFARPLHAGDVACRLRVAAISSTKATGTSGSKRSSSPGCPCDGF